MRYKAVVNISGMSNLPDSQAEAEAKVKDALVTALCKFVDMSSGEPLAIEFEDFEPEERLVAVDYTAVIRVSGTLEDYETQLSDDELKGGDDWMLYEAIGEHIEGLVESYNFNSMDTEVEEVTEVRDN